MVNLQRLETQNTFFTLQNKYILSSQHNKQHYTGLKHTIGNGTLLENK